MAFSQRFGYAAHALAYMSKKQFGTLTTLSELAEWMRTIWPAASETYLSNVIQRLARGGVLLSHRGIAGGYSLSRPPEEITLRELVQILEGVMQERCALSLGPSCPGQGRCNIERTLRQIEEDYLESLAGISIGEIADGMTIKFAKPRTVPV